MSNSEFLSYGKQWIDESDIQAVLEVLRSDFIVQGPKIAEFENKLCEVTGAKHCVVVSNGTAALQMSMAALDMAPGSEGITTPITFVATSNAMIYAGLEPVFVDVERDTHNINPNLIREKINERTRLIVPVHYAGQPADMEAIQNIAKEQDLYVIEDAAHAIGSRYADGTPVGNCKYSDLTIFSFHPVKTITTGQGGAITTNNTELYERLVQLRNHGITNQADRLINKDEVGPWYYEMQYMSFNFRMTDIQAALGISQLNKLNLFVERRRKIVERYNRAFESADFVDIPVERKGVYSAFHLYSPEFDFAAIGKSRKDVMLALKQHSIGTQVLYIPVHLQPYYRKRYGYSEGDFLEAERFYSRTLSLPLYPKLTDEQVDYVIDNVYEVMTEKHK